MHPHARDKVEGEDRNWGGNWDMVFWVVSLRLYSEELALWLPWSTVARRHLRRYVLKRCVGFDVVEPNGSYTWGLLLLFRLSLCW
jgi:hypothetical protein